MGSIVPPLDPVTHEDSNDPVPALLEQGSRNAGVHAAAHGDEDVLGSGNHGLHDNAPGQEPFLEFGARARLRARPPLLTSSLLLLEEQSPLGNPMFLIVMLGVIWYFLLIRPQSKEKKVQRAMREALKKGDKVLTQSGVIAKVHSVQENEVTLNLDGTARMRIARETVVRVLDESQKSEAAAG